MAKPALVAKTAQRTGALTTAYDAVPLCVPVNTQNQAHIAVQYTKGSSTGATLKIEFAFDDFNGLGNGGVTQAMLQSLTYFRYSKLATTSTNGTNTQDQAFVLNTVEVTLPGGSDNYYFDIPLLATAVRVNAKAVGTPTSSVCNIFVVSGNG